MMGEVSPVIFWNVVLTLVIAPAIWMFRNLMGEVKRIDILLNRTREDYSTKQELREDMRMVTDALHRLEDKLDKVLERGKQDAYYRQFTNGYIRIYIRQER